MYNKLVVNASASMRMGFRPLFFVRFLKKPQAASKIKTTRGKESLAAD